MHVIEEYRNAHGMLQGHSLRNDNHHKEYRNVRERTHVEILTCEACVRHNNLMRHKVNVLGLVRVTLKRQAGSDEVKPCQGLLGLFGRGVGGEQLHGDIVQLYDQTDGFPHIAAQHSLQQHTLVGTPLGRAPRFLSEHYGPCRAKDR